jgi:transcriptional regulator with XRE-family HTH domain
MQVAINVGVSHPAYRLWEMGGTKPKAENEQKLREVLKIEEATKHGGNRRSK